MKALAILYLIVTEATSLLAIIMFLSVVLLWAEIIPMIHFH